MEVVVADLVRLVETPKESAADALAALGGIEGVAEKLHVQLEVGLSDTDEGKDIAAREARFGRNYVEPEQAASIFELMWQAWQVRIIVSFAGDMLTTTTC